MHHLIKENSRSTYEFTVNKKHVNKYKTLHTSILFQKAESLAKVSMTHYNGILETSLTTFEIDIKRKAFLHDELVVTNRVQKLNNSSLELCITIAKKSKQNDLICKAIFGYTLRKVS
ncbi:MAG: hypothetical protein JKY02_04345 [Flavobacteriaceae bacterium]|nr:hypothetical protein [Flavobacteriaceae bacterium]